MSRSHSMHSLHHHIMTLIAAQIGVVSMACFEGNKDKLGSQFLITLSSDLQRLDKGHSIFGEVAEGFETLTKINEAFVDDDDRPMRYALFDDDHIDLQRMPTTNGIYR